MVRDFSVRPVAPKAAVGALLTHTLPSPRLTRAFAILCKHLWPSMRPHPWWDGSPGRCIWASHAAAELLRRLGFEVFVVSAIMQTLALDKVTNVYLREGVTVGMPTSDHPGTHAVVLVEDSTGPVLLETCLFQMQRHRFCPLPEMALLSVMPELTGLLHEVPEGDRTGVAKVSSWRMPEPCPQGWALDLEWLVWNGEPNWAGCPDSSPVRAKAVVNRIFRVAAGSLRACERLET